MYPAVPLYETMQLINTSKHLTHYLQYVASIMYEQHCFGSKSLNRSLESHHSPSTDVSLDFNTLFLPLSHRPPIQRSHCCIL